MKITSTAFADGEDIPDQYSMYGDNEIPPLYVEDVPRRARSIALIVDDPDAPSGTFTHWVLFNVSPTTDEIGEDGPPPGSVQGLNDYGMVEYGGPKPPSGEHRYFFKAFALDSYLDLKEGADREEVESAMEGHILEEATLMGKFAYEKN